MMTSGSGKPGSGPASNLPAFSQSLATRWKLRTQTLSFGRIPAVMGIVNVTPDSFSDGGKHDTAAAAVAHAKQLAEQGASILDIGGESTRPYSEPVSQQEELDRVIPVIKHLAAAVNIPISIDTSKASVARAAIAAGAEIINDVTGLEGDPEMMQVAIESGAGVCAMHMKGNPQTMQDDPQYHDVVREIHGYLAQRKMTLIDAGIDREKICLDPGIGFGKSHEHNLRLIDACDQYHDLGCPLLIGHSRKGFIGKILRSQSEDPGFQPTLDERDAGTLAISMLLSQKGIQVIRVHEVQRTVAALKVMEKFGS